MWLLGCVQLHIELSLYFYQVEVLQIPASIGNLWFCTMVLGRMWIPISLQVERYSMKIVASQTAVQHSSYWWCSVCDKCLDFREMTSTVVLGAPRTPGTSYYTRAELACSKAAVLNNRTSFLLKTRIYITCLLLTAILKQLKLNKNLSSFCIIKTHPKERPRNTVVDSKLSNKICTLSFPNYPPLEK